MLDDSNDGALDDWASLLHAAATTPTARIGALVCAYGHADRALKQTLGPSASTTSFHDRLDRARRAGHAIDVRAAKDATKIRNLVVHDARLPGFIPVLDAIIAFARTHLALHRHWKADVADRLGRLRLELLGAPAACSTYGVATDTPLDFSVKFSDERLLAAAGLEPDCERQGSLVLASVKLGLALTEINDLACHSEAGSYQYQDYTWLAVDDGTQHETPPPFAALPLLLKTRFALTRGWIHSASFAAVRDAILTRNNVVHEARVPSADDCPLHTAALLAACKTLSRHPLRVDHLRSQAAFVAEQQQEDSRRARQARLADEQRTAVALDDGIRAATAGVKNALDELCSVDQVVHARLVAEFRQLAARGPDAESAETVLAAGCFAAVLMGPAGSVAGMLVAWVCGLSVWPGALVGVCLVGLYPAVWLAFDAERARERRIATLRANTEAEYLAARRAACEHLLSAVAFLEPRARWGASPDDEPGGCLPEAATLRRTQRAAADLVAHARQELARWDAAGPRKIA